MGKRMNGAATIRLGSLWDIPVLLDIQAAAASRFAALDIIGTADGMPESIPAAALEKASYEQLLFVAEFNDCPVGFAFCSIERPDLYLDQISVAPQVGRKGAGTALLDAVIGVARQRGLWGVSLSTFRSIPWNGPFFAKNAFQEVPRSGLALWQLDIERAQAAIMDVGQRCFMRRPIAQRMEAMAA
jgi:GNAT superfamily N-acetyltransferase